MVSNACREQVQRVGEVHQREHQGRGERGPQGLLDVWGRVEYILSAYISRAHAATRSLPPPLTTAPVAPRLHRSSEGRRPQQQRAVLQAHHEAMLLRHDQRCESIHTHAHVLQFSQSTTQRPNHPNIRTHRHQTTHAQAPLLISQSTAAHVTCAKASCLPVLKSRTLVACHEPTHTSSEHACAYVTRDLQLLHAAGKKATLPNSPNRNLFTTHR